MNFKTHLESLGYSESICHSYYRYGNHFETWMQQNYIKPGELCYQHLRNFIEHRIKAEKKSIDMQLSALRHYCQYLIATKQVTESFTNDFYIKSVAVEPPAALLTKERLQFIYDNYTAKGLMAKRNKVMLGLLIYQALSPAEMEELKPENIHLKKKKVHVPETRTGQSRVLSLHKKQLGILAEYLSTTRMFIMEMAGQETDKLFMCMGGSDRLSNATDKLARQIRKYAPEVRATRQIRMSVMNEWLQEYGFEHLQQMAGKRYVMKAPPIKTQQIP